MKIQDSFVVAYKYIYVEIYDLGLDIDRVIKLTTQKNVDKDEVTREDVIDCLCTSVIKDIVHVKGGNRLGFRMSYDGQEYYIHIDRNKETEQFFIDHGMTFDTADEFEDRDYRKFKREFLDKFLR